MKKSIVVLYLLITLFLTNAVSAAPGLQEQLDLIADNADLWKQKIDYGLWGYAVVDLDQNGYLEIMSASLQGTGMYTYLKVFTVDPAGAGLSEVKQDRPENESAPDVMQESTHAFYDLEAKEFYYIFSDYIRNGFAESYENKRAIWFEEETWKEIPLANRITICTDIESCSDSFTDSEGKEISEKEFQSAENTYFNGFSRGMLIINWNMTDNESFDNITREELIDNLTNIGYIKPLPDSGQ